MVESLYHDPTFCDHLFGTFGKFPEFNISYPLMRARACAFQGVRNVNFSENFANILNELSLIILMLILQHKGYWDIACKCWNTNRTKKNYQIIRRQNQNATYIKNSLAKGRFYWHSGHPTCCIVDTRKFVFFFLKKKFWLSWRSVFNFSKWVRFFFFVLFWFVLTSSKNSSWSVKYRQVMWPNWWHHQSPSFFKGNRSSCLALRNISPYGFSLTRISPY